MKEKLKRIDKKTLELKKMEGMEDITNFFSGVATGAGDSDNPALALVEPLDTKKLEIMKKLNFR